MRNFARNLLIPFALLFVLACGRSHETRPITAKRVVADPPRIPPMAPFDDATRFGFNRGGVPRDHNHGAAAAAPSGWEWELPEGWTALPGGGDRQASFRIEGADGVDVSFSVFPGDAGGVLPNVNRWRGQMGQPPLTEADAGRLPSAPFAGGKAILAEIDGTYTPRGGEPHPGYRMIAIIGRDRTSTLFLKMTGPVEQVAAARSGLEALAASFQAHRSLGDALTGPQADLGALEFDLPEGWSRQEGERQFRMATFVIDGREKTECWLTAMNGSGGGVEMNFDRWRQQMGLPPLSEAEIRALPTVQVLGRAAPYLKAEGGTVALLVVPVFMPESSLFIRMTGPIESVKAEEENFLRFCGSLR